MKRSRGARKLACCYWCGAEATSPEHVPPRGFFPKSQRTNLITVPSCPVHNQKLSALDERMRFYIQAGCGSKEALKAFEGSTLRSLNRPEALRFIESLAKTLRPFRLPEGVTAEFSIDPQQFQYFFEKITRGIYYHHKSRPFGGHAYCIFRQSFMATKEVSESYERLVPLFQRPDFAQDGVTSHPEIFRYRYIDNSNAETHVFCVAMQFYEDFEAISMLKKSVADQTKAPS